MIKLITSTIMATIFIFIISCGGSRVSTVASDGSEYYYDIYKNATVYEEAEDGSTLRWEVWRGFPVENVDIGANGSDRSILVTKNWDLNDRANPINNANYVLPMGNDSQFILEFDKMKVKSETQHCFTVGVTVETEYGIRYISFNTFYDREGYEADTQEIGDGIEMVFPLSMLYVSEGGVWQHLKFDLNEYIHRFELDNTIYNVKNFYFQGGNDHLDNIRLTSQ